MCDEKLCGLRVNLIKLFRLVNLKSSLNREIFKVTQEKPGFNNCTYNYY